MTPKQLVPTLETLVPTLETCIFAKDKGYPQGKSYFVWVFISEGYSYVSERRPWMSEYEEIVDAPTLQELLDKLPKYTYVSRDGAAYIVTAPPDKPDCDGYSELDDNFNAAEAAALLWLQLRKEKV